MNGNGGGFSTIAREEFINDISLPTLNQEYNLPGQGGLMPMDRFYFGLYFQFEGRATMPAATPPTAAHADAPYSIVDRVRVEGYHRLRRNNERFIDLRMADLRELYRIYSIHSPIFTNSINGAAAVTTFGFTVNDTNDFRFSVVLPFVPLMMPMHEQIRYLLDGPNYDDLKLTVKYADTRSIFNVGGGSLATLSAFGSATGSPRMRVWGIFAMGGLNRFQGFVPGRLWRYFNENSSSDMTATGTQRRIHSVPRGERIRAILLKTGVLTTTATSGNTAYASVSDAILTNLEVNQGTNRLIRRLPDFHGIKETQALHYGLLPNTGYALVDFAKRGNLREALDVRALIAGSTGNTDLFIQSDVTGAANQAAVAVWEELRGLPQIAVARSPMRR